MSRDPRASVLERLVNSPPKPKPILYAIYTRQSVEKLADFSSCEAQFHTCRDFINAFNDPRLHWCDQRFDDEGQSGATLDRPAMCRLRKVVDLGGIDRIYAVALDRLTRSMRDAIVLLDEFEKAGVDMHFVHQPELTFGAQGARASPRAAPTSNSTAAASRARCRSANSPWQKPVDNR